MLKIDQSGKRYQFLVFIVVTIISAQLFGLLGKLLSILFLDINVFDSSFTLSMLSMEDEIRFLRFNQPFSTIGIFLIPPLIFRYLLNDRFGLTFSKFRISNSTLLSTVVLIIVVRPIVSWLAILNSTIDLSFLGKLGEYVISTSDLIAEKTLLLARADSIDKLLINIFIIAILPAIGEELFFRAIIQRLLYKVSGRFHLSIWVTAIVFGVMHFNVRGVLPIIFLGLILGYIYFYTENIWLAILAHFINNASLLLIFFKFPVETESVVSDNISIPSLLFSVLMSFSLLFFLYTVWEKRKSANSLKQ